MQGTSRSMQDLSNHVGMGSFMENLLTASLIIRHTMSVVTGEKERKRSAVEMSRTSGAGPPSVADRTSETFWIEIWKAKGKAMDTNTGSSPGYQSPRNSLETPLYSEEARGHWTPTGAEPIPHGSMDAWIIRKYFHELIQPLFQLKMHYFYQRSQNSIRGQLLFH